MGMGGRVLGSLASGSGGHAIQPQVLAAEAPSLGGGARDKKKEANCWRLDNDKKKRPGQRNHVVGWGQ